MEPYVPILIFALVAVGFVYVTLQVARVLRHGSGVLRFLGRKAEPSRTNRDPYECGNEPDSLALEHRFSIRYYLIAVLFVIFDVETVFLYPWAVMFDELALFGFVEMTVFLVILIVGYAYVWRRGALRWA